MNPTHDEVMNAINGNDPVIRPMQIWRIPPTEGRRERKLRILAKHPEPDPNTDRAGAGAAQWIYREEPVGNQLIETVLSWIPEYNLRRLFELHEDSLAPEDQLYEKSVALPYTVLIDTTPGGAAHLMEFKTSAQIDKITRDFFQALNVLEAIGAFAQGIAGDEAANFLKRVGVWSERVRPTEG